MKFSIEYVKGDDREALRAFWTTCITEAFKVEGIEDEAFIKEEIAEKMSLLDHSLSGKDGRYHFLIGKMASEIVGSIGYVPAGEAILKLTGETCLEMGEIGTVFVRPNFKGRGVGTKLMNAMLLFLMGKGIQSFCLDSGYGSAQKVWTHKFGAPVVTAKNFWGEGLDHMVWIQKIEDLKIVI